jgi:integrase
MGWVKKHKGRNGIVYYAIYRDLQGRERSAGAFARKGEAEHAWQEVETALRAGKRMGDPKLGRQHFRHYVLDTWFPQHPIEELTREIYTYLLNRYILDEFGCMQMQEIMPAHVRQWILDLQNKGIGAATIFKCKTIFDAIFTTAVNDQVALLHPGRGAKTPPIPDKPKMIVTVEQFDRIHLALPDDMMRLLVETDIESGLRWGELTELRVKDLDCDTGILTVSRVVIQLKAKDRPVNKRFVVKHYPKNRRWRQIKLAPHIVVKLKAYIRNHGLKDNDLLFTMTDAHPACRTRPTVLPDPDTLGLTEPNDKRRQYRHGTLSGYQLGKCRCRHCKDAIAAYRASRRAQGKDTPRTPRTVMTDGHVPGDWFRKQIWAKALQSADIGVHVTPHSLRHTHASWLLAGGADLQVVKERLGHASIRTSEGYLHTLPGAQDAALTALDSIRSPRDKTTADATGPIPQNPTSTMGTATTEQDEELARLRSMVGKFKEILGPLNDIA